MSEQVQVDNLVRIATAYAEGHGMTLQGIGRQFYGVSRFFPELQAGKRTITFKKYYGVIQAMRDSWPKGIDWPKTRAVIIEPLQ